MSSRSSIAFAWIALLVFSPPVGLKAQDTGQEKWEQVQKSIRGDWYDRSNGQYRPPQLQETQDHPVRKSGRLASPPTAWNWNWEFPNWNLGLGRFSGVFSNAIIAVLALLLLVCIVLVMMHFTGSGGMLHRSRRSDGFSIDPARIQDLPFAADQILEDPLSQARQCLEAGDYNRAIVFLYGYQLLALDQARRIHLQKGKTNGMYLGELKSLPRLKEIVAATVLKFEQVYFGKHQLSKASFWQSWSQLDEFHQLLNADAPMTGQPPVEQLVGEAH
jgi:hypothetical protein